MLWSRNKCPFDLALILEWKVELANPPWNLGGSMHACNIMCVWQAVLYQTKCKWKAVSLILRPRRWLSELKCVFILQSKQISAPVKKWEVCLEVQVTCPKAKVTCQNKICMQHWTQIFGIVPVYLLA